MKFAGREPQGEQRQRGEWRVDGPAGRRRNDGDQQCKGAQQQGPQNGEAIDRALPRGEVAAAIEHFAAPAQKSRAV